MVASWWVSNEYWGYHACADSVWRLDYRGERAAAKFLICTLVSNKVGNVSQQRYVLIYTTVVIKVRSIYVSLLSEQQHTMCILMFVLELFVRYNLRTCLLYSLRLFDLVMRVALMVGVSAVALQAGFHKLMECWMLRVWMHRQTETWFIACSCICIACFCDLFWHSPNTPPWICCAHPISDLWRACTGSMAWWRCGTIKRRTSC